MSMYLVGVVVMFLGLTIQFFIALYKDNIPEDFTLKSTILIFLVAPWISWFGVILFGGSLYIDSMKDEKDER